MQVDYFTFAVNPVDRLVQCSDGLYTCFTPDEICELVTHAPSGEACRELVALAEKRGADDNLSVQIVHVHRIEHLMYYRGLPIYQEPERPVSNEIEVGQVLDNRFQITGVISRSGMASIFKATDLLTGHVLAVKVPFMQFESDPAFFSRFQREEEIGKKLDHPCILRIVPLADKSRPYIVMEYLEGQTLRQAMRRLGRMPLEHALSITSRICEALEYMHGKNVIHRDLKPENVMLCNDGSLRIMDFGIAKAAGTAPLTFSGFTAAMGTPDYMAPEQVKGKRGDERHRHLQSGAMLYEMLTGAPPFEGANSVHDHECSAIGDPVARKRQPDIPPAVEEIILHAMEQNPYERYPSAVAMKADLDHPDKVQVTGRAERLRPPAVWRTRWRMARIVLIAILIPIVVFGLMFVFSRVASPVDRRQNSEVSVHACPGGSLPSCGKECSLHWAGRFIAF